MGCDCSLNDQSRIGEDPDDYVSSPGFQNRKLGYGDAEALGDEVQRFVWIRHFVREQWGDSSRCEARQNVIVKLRVKATGRKNQRRVG